MLDHISSVRYAARAMQGQRHLATHQSKFAASEFVGKICGSNAARVRRKFAIDQSKLVRSEGFV